MQTSYRGRKALNLGAVVSPRAKSQQKAANSPVPAAVPQPSPNTVSSNNPQLNQQPSNLVGITSTHITAQQPQQQPQQTNILQIPTTTTTQIMKEHHQQPMVGHLKPLIKIYKWNRYGKTYKEFMT